MKTVVDAARDTDMILIREGPEELDRTTAFDVCDRAVSAFEVLT